MSAKSKNCLKRRRFSSYVYLSKHFVDLSDNYVDFSDNYFALSDIKLTNRWQLVTLTRYKIKYLANSYNEFFFLKVKIMI